jgi:MFS transporter, SP family, arabinose:H+ symporter
MKPSFMKTNFRYLLTISVVTALGGLLFGFDISVISGTIPFIQDYFGLNEAMKGMGCKQCPDWLYYRGFFCRKTG